jgi:hypothetical protein
VEQRQCVCRTMHDVRAVEPHLQGREKVRSQERRATVSVWRYLDIGDVAKGIDQRPDVATDACRVGTERSCIQRDLQRPLTDLPSPLGESWVRAVRRTSRRGRAPAAP